tara:strand:- start:100 stop:666 length:567 start_codon:yes stop_codon:yes gene_type:complete
MTENQFTDEELIKRFQNGDKRAYNKLVLRYKDRLHHFIYRFLNDADRADDLVQDTLIKLYTHKDSYKEIALFSTWIYTIAGNLARTELRKIKRRNTYSISDLSINDKEFVVETRSEYGQNDKNRELLSENIQIVLAKLPSEFRIIIILRDIQELSYEQISKIVSLPLGTVKSRINRARLKLKDLLAEK